MLQKPAKGGDAAQRQGAAANVQHVHGMLLPQPAEPAHVDYAAHGVHHAAGGEEQQGLEERVGEQVKHRRDIANCAHACRRRAQAMNM